MSARNVLRRIWAGFVGGDSLYLDADQDSRVIVSADDTIDLYLNGAKDFTFSPNSFAPADGSTIVANSIDLNGGTLIIDANGDTKITNAETDDEITFTIANAVDFQMTANTFTAAAGSSIVVSGANISPAARIVNIAATETAVPLTAAAHAERLVILPVITSAGLTITLPAATGTGHRYTVLNNGVQTLSTTITALAGDIFSGLAKGWHLTAGANDTFAPDGNDIKYTMDVTTTGGDGGDTLVFIDIATDNWWTDITFFGSGTLATGYA